MILLTLFAFFVLTILTIILFDIILIKENNYEKVDSDYGNVVDSIRNINVSKMDRLPKISKIGNVNIGRVTLPSLPHINICNIIK